jgi:hypothetical protein
MLDLAMSLLLPEVQPKAQRAVVGVYAMVFAAVVLLVDESFGSIVRFYVPALLLFLIAAAREALHRRPGWSAIAAGLLISVGAALLQQARVAIDPDYFDHNAVYHVFQGVALVFLYVGFRRTTARPG